MNPYFHTIPNPFQSPDPFSTILYAPLGIERRWWMGVEE